MKKAVYLDGLFVQSVDVDGDFDLPEGVYLYDIEIVAPKVDGPVSHIESRVVEDHEARTRRIEQVVVPANDIGRAARLERAFGGSLLIAELLNLKNEIRALRNEPALSLDDYMAELASKL